MNNILFITKMYVSRFLVATLLTYVYLTNANPSPEGRLEKNSPAFFSDELENADDADDQLEADLNNYQSSVESSQK